MTAKIKKLIKAPILAIGVSLSAMALTACVELAVATVAITTVDVIHDRRTAGSYFDDSGIELEMKKLLLGSKRMRSQAHVSPTSYNGILLLTGEATSEEIKQEVVNYANRIYGARQVVDETRVSGKTGLLSRTSDSLLTGKVKSTLLLKMKTTANQIKVVSEHGNVYLMGIVTDAEATRATEIARTVGGVVRVVRVFEIKAN
jgi:osmotically-inducible protein OsmY